MDLISSTVPGARLTVSDDQAELYLGKGWKRAESKSTDSEPDSTPSDEEKPVASRRRKSTSDKSDD